MPGTAITAIPFEGGIEIHKSQISEKTVKKCACGAQVEATFGQKLIESVPSRPHRASKKWSLRLPI